MDIGLKIKELAKAKKMTARELGGQIGRSRQAIHDIYANKVSISVDILQKISNALGVEIHTFFTTESTLPNSKEELIELINNVSGMITNKNYIPLVTIKTLILNIVKNAFEGNGLVFLELKFDVEKGKYIFNEHYKELNIKPTEKELNYYSKSVFGNVFRDIKESLNTSDYTKLVKEYIDKMYEKADKNKV